MTTAFLNGFLTSAGLIVSIGAQNAHVLASGLRRQHHLVVAAICALCDATLIALGTGGVGSAIARSPTVQALATWGGVAFLLLYGLRAFRSALRPSGLQQRESITALGPAITLTLAVTLLNPHVYLDTVLLLGAVSAGFTGVARLGFALGAMSASVVWFFGLALGAQALGPVLNRPTSWRVIDALVGMSMWSVAAMLASGVFG